MRRMVPTLPWKPNQMTSVATSLHVVRPSPGHGSHSQTTGAHAPRVAKPATLSLLSSGSAHLRGDGSGCWIRLGVPAAGPGPGRLHRGLDPCYTMGGGDGVALPVGSILVTTLLLCLQSVTPNDAKLNAPHVCWDSK